MKTNNLAVLNALAHAVNLTTKFIGIDAEVMECSATQGNVKKIKKIAESVKYAGLHLHVSLHSYGLKLWLEGNTEEVMYEPYTLIGFDHDLESLS